MENTDFELIKNTISGDQEAFAELVRKYHKRVHALAWRKTGDFHIAEEITQDTFLRAYKNLDTLKNPNLFAGWLYVIANRLCSTWLKKKAPDMQSLETVSAVELEENRYAEYIAKEREEYTADKRVDLVKRLLQKLPESERIVITLHYLAGSSIKEIGEFLGVSLNTVKSRLYRARQRLQKEEHMVRETLGSFQPSMNLTETIMRNIKEIGTPLTPSVPSGSKPFIPWAVATSAFILIALMLGLGAKHLLRFQQPYSLDSASETTVEIVDTTIMKDFPLKPDDRNQISNAFTPGKGNNSEQNTETSQASSASGQIIDVAGNPVTGIKIALTPVKINNGTWFPVQRNELGEPLDMSLYQSETDAQGRFNIADTVTGPVLLTLFPYDKPKPDVKMVTVEIGGLLFYPRVHFYHGIIFTAPPDEDIKDVIVTVQHSPKIRGKVIQKDGTPLANKIIDLNIRVLRFMKNSQKELTNDKGLNTVMDLPTLNPDGDILSVHDLIELPGAVTTDDAGYFEKHVDSKDLVRYIGSEIPTFYISSVDDAGYFEKHVDSKDLVRYIGSEIPTFYILSVKYERLSAKSQPVILRPNADIHEFVFNLDISPYIRTHLRPSFPLDAIGVWIINPENGHAYKKIGCSNPQHAIVQASKEEAHLVTINDAAEQNWLNKVFSGTDSFIGLNDIAIEGQWEWQSGEPVVYTNWKKGVLEDKKSKYEDYVILSRGKWKDIGPKNSEWFNIRTAILEKKLQHVKK